MNKDNVLRRLFRNAETSYFLCDLSKCIGPVIDLIFIGRFVGIEGVTVMGYVAPLVIVMELIGSTISNGAKTKVSVAVGAGDVEEAKNIFSSSVIFGGILGVLFSALAVILCSGIVVLLGGNDPVTSAMTAQYIQGYMIGVPFMGLGRILVPFLQMEGQYKRLTFNSFFTTAVDVLGDFLVVFFIKGKMFEIALATSVGYIFSFAYLALFFVRKKSKTIFRLSPKRFNLKNSLDILRLGSSCSIIKIGKSLGGMVINNMLTAMSVSYLVAAYGVFIQIVAFIKSVWDAPADSLSSFAGLFIGEEDRRSLKTSIRIALTHGLIFSSVCAVILFLFAGPITAVLISSDVKEAVNLTVECIRIECFALPLLAVNYVATDYLIALKRVRLSIIFCFFNEFGLIVPVTFLFLNIMGYRGAFIARVVSAGLLILISFVYICCHNKGMAFSDKMLLLPESFGIPPEDELILKASSHKGILYMSTVGRLFALEHGFDEKKAGKYRLVIEELSTMLREHGFNDGKTHNINLRLVAKNEELIIRLRDDCTPFNLTEYYEMQEKVRKEDLGLHLIFGKAGRVQYTNTFGANNLIVRF